MSLITNSKSSLYGGVNLQSAEHRLENQVEECINATPTVNQGLLKRNPTETLAVNGNIDYDENMFTYEYDRGLAGDNEEKYSIQITDAGMNIVNVLNGNVYSKGSGLAYEDDAENYMQPFVNQRGYSAVTIKDTTFLANKNVSPQLDPLTQGGVDNTTSSVTVYERTIWFNKASELNRLWSDGSESPQSYFAPTKILHSHIGEDPVQGIPLFETNLYGSITSFLVDGASINHVIDEGKFVHPASVDLFAPNIGYNEYIADVETRLREVLEIPSPELYSVDIVDETSRKGIRVRRYDNTDFTSFTAAITINPITDTIRSTSITLDSIEADYLNSVASSSYSDTLTLAASNYLEEGFIWIKGSNPTAAYDYTYTLESETATYNATDSGSTTTEAAATAIALDINTNASADFLAVANGSIVHISTVDNSILTNVYMNDSFGNQASFGWAREVQSSRDLPKTLGFNALVKVIGTNDNAFASYWLQYKDGQWRETLGYATQPKILPSTMPHILVRNADDTFTLKEYAEWTNKRVGDEDTNKPPSFTQNGNVIKDIFFFKNRLGFITNRTVIMSEVGEYGNFWRTTVSTVLDSDRIDTTVDTTKAIQLEYATYLEDSLMLFSDKAQFKLEGGNILSPKSIQVSQTSAYEINKNIRPLFMNDKLFFAAKRGDYTAMMQYFVSGDGRVSEAIDISSHCETYIPLDVKSLSGSPINNMLFLTAASTPNTIYVYKYLDSGTERIQSAWFKWTYNGTIYGAFSLGKNLHILINRLDPMAVANWVLGNGIWNSDNLWTNDGLWISSPDDLLASDNFETQAIHQQDHTGYFIDASYFLEDTNNVTGLTSTASPAILEYDSADIAFTEDVVISLLDTTIASYTITAHTTGGDFVATDSSLILLRTPSIQLESVTIVINDAIGTSFTGFTVRFTSEPDRDLTYNGDFTHTTEKWTFTDWTIDYGEKDMGALIPVNVELGEWILSSGDKKLTEGTLKMKSCQINSEDNSDFELKIRDVSRNTERSIKSEYTVGRKPMVYGSSKNMRLDIINLSDRGFRINSVVLEGNYNNRNRRI